ncbi:LytR family transcriptional regulator [Georgenia sp. 311]|uniref:LytR C-terminal domain-containing protein n=1 Tax=Georgenia sp. 311 TaxID=2585134 RepID=UPI0011124069|nr:LytR C-terminal domain-containing protein [Georgenia sp. 311]TNC17525.1 LytR family transcriptional regulator [Georgenia sp. 311]
MTTDLTEAQRRRAARRRHLQQRQTLIFGILITAMVAVALVAAAMWGGVIPSPFARPFSSPEPTDAEAPAVPCPPADALPAPFPEINANVYNATDQSGLAARTARGLAQYGVVIAQESNYGGSFEGVADIVAGPRGLQAAYTVAAIIPGSTVSLDGRDDATVDVILGGAFSEVPAPEAAGFDPDEPLAPPPGCSPVTVPDDDVVEEAPAAG